MTEQLGKYIQLENHEQAGAKKGYVKDENVARLAADTEEAVRADGGTPEEANRAAEKAIASGIVGEIVKEAAIKAIDKDVKSDIKETDYDYTRKRFDQLFIHDEVKDAVEVKKEYVEFQKNLDREKLDELRKQIREEQK